MSLFPNYNGMQVQTLRLFHHSYCYYLPICLDIRAIYRYLYLFHHLFPILYLFSLVFQSILALFHIFFCYFAFFCFYCHFDLFHSSRLSNSCSLFEFFIRFCSLYVIGNFIAFKIRHTQKTDNS